MDKISRITPAGPMRWMRQGYRLLLVSGLLALAGCTGQSGGLLDGDPLRGGGRMIPENAPTTAGARGVSDADPWTASETPKLPPLESATSAAALTAEGQGVEVGPRPVGATPVKLKAPTQPATTNYIAPVPAAPTGGVSTASARPASGGVVLVAATAPTPSAPPTPSSPLTPSAPATYEQLQQMLQARGVAWQQLKTGVAKDEWLFACAVPDPNPDHKNMERHFEARAVGACGLAAIRAVIEEIDKDRPGK